MSIEIKEVNYKKENSTRELNGCWKTRNKKKLMIGRKMVWKAAPGSL